jgi:general secretion pathway protein D
LRHLRTIKNFLVHYGCTAAVVAAFVFAGLISLSAIPASAEDEAVAAGALEQEQDAILLNFESADIREVIYTFAAALEINYWLDPRVQGQVTARSFGPIFLDDLFPVFLQILRSNGFAAVKQGDLYMIVPAEDGKTKATLGSSSGEERFVVDLVKVTHVSAEKIIELLNPFVSPGGDVVAYARNNLIIITDLASNAQRLRELVRTFDNDTFSDMTGRVYKIEHAGVEDIAAEVQTILEGYKAAESGSSVHLIPLLRLNSIAVVGFDPAVFAAVEYWLGVLDVPGSGGTERRVFVYQVENSKAVDLAGVLNEVYSGLAEENEGERRGRSSALAERGVGLGGGVDQARRNQQNRNQQQGRQQMRAQLTLDSQGEGAGSALFEQEIRIVADEITNALVILATPRDFQTIKGVLHELDIVPRQVLIEMIIAEISLTDGVSLGINTQLGTGSSNGGTSDGGTGSDDVNSSSVLGKLGLAAMSPTAAASHLFGGADGLGGNRFDGSVGSAGLNGTISLFDGDVQTTLAAIATLKNTKILSRPHIMAADNQEARILVGSEVPIVTSQSDTNVETGGNSSILQNIQYRDTGVVVSVTPQVNSDGLVNMSVSQEVSQIIGANETGDVSGIVSPSFTSRQAETTVIVQSGETIVIGGIINEKVDEIESGVPFLKEIPWLGQIFSSTSESTERTELIILITPYVIRDANEARTVTSQFKSRVDTVLKELDLDGGDQERGNHTSILLKPVI